MYVQGHTNISSEVVKVNRVKCINNCGITKNDVDLTTILFTKLAEFIVSKDLRQAGD